MRQIRTSGSMSGEGNRGGVFAATAPFLDSTSARNDTPRRVRFFDLFFSFV